MKNRLFRTEVAAVVVAALIITFLLMVKPIIGIADNGDFGRIMGSTGLTYLVNNNPDRFIGFINRLYIVNDLPLNLAGHYISSEAFIVKFAIFLNRLVRDNGIFDIRFLSLVYSAVFLISLYIILKYNRQKSALTNWFLAFLLIGVFADVGYISYFNSLYGEAVSYAFLFLMTGTALYLAKLEKPNLWILACFFIASFFFTGAKVQNIPVIIVIFFFCLRLWFIRKDKPWRSTLVISSILLLAFSVSIYLSIPEGIKNCNKYQTVFFGILKDSKDPAKDLKELGLDPKFSVLAGTNFFMKNLPYNLKDPAMETELYNKIKRIKILAFYLRHPIRYIEKLENTAYSAFSIRQEGFGNYEKAENISFGQMSDSFGTWSSIKNSVLPHSLLFVVAFYTLFFGVLTIRHIKTKEFSGKVYLEVFMLIGLIGLIQFLVPVLGDGEADLSKHLFLFNACFDIMLVLSIVWAFDRSLRLSKKVLVTRNV